jgi:hypothetical protein
MTGKEIGLTAIKGRAISAADLAKMLHVSDRWVEMRMKDGSLPINWFPVGERIRLVDSVDVDAWLLSIRVSAGTLPLPIPKRAIEKIQEKEVST